MLCLNLQSADLFSFAIVIQVITTDIYAYIQISIYILVVGHRIIEYLDTEEAQRSSSPNPGLQKILQNIMGNITMLSMKTEK